MKRGDKWGGKREGNERQKRIRERWKGDNRDGKRKGRRVRE